MSDMAIPASGLKRGVSRAPAVCKGRERAFLSVAMLVMIGIGESLTAPPLPHHLAYGSVPRRFDRVERQRAT